MYQALAGLPGLEIIPPSDDIRTLPPAILKPVQRWTGKQVPTPSDFLFDHMKQKNEVTVFDLIRTRT